MVVILIYSMIVFLQIDLRDCEANKICSLKNTQALKKLVGTRSSRNDKLDYGSDYRNQAIKILHNMLEEGLTNRVKQICVSPKEVAEWECTEDDYDDIGEILIGLELNPEFCFNIVDKGPEANLPEVCKLFKYGIKKYQIC